MLIDVSAALPSIQASTKIKKNYYFYLWWRIDLISKRKHFFNDNEGFGGNWKV
jgi:hypothetical protein